jgi:formate hydrogenlyase subunit 3/multisubunit Na+/H+ antiporter MnhD subunit
MSAPIVWIGLPVLAGLILAALSRWRNFVMISAVCLAVGLALIAWLLPSGDQIVLGSWSMPFADRIGIGGIQIVLAEAERPLLVMLYGLTAFLLAGAMAARSHRRLVPLGLVLVGLVVAAVTIEPHYLGALVFPLAVFDSILILAPPGGGVSKGLSRFLIFQIIGVVMLLLAGWLLSSDVKLLADPLALMRASLVLGIGFAFLLAIFPLYTWIIMVAEDCHPYAATFVFSILFGGYTLYFLSFLSHYPWLLLAVKLPELVRFVGVLMVATGGAWAAFQRNLGRILGYALVIEIGHALLAISFQDGALFYAMVVTRMVSMAVWGLGLSVIKSNAGNLAFKTVQGMARKFPVASAATLLSHFSLAGMPLLAGFPPVLALWTRLVTYSVPLAVWCFLGSFGLVAAGFRSLAVLVMGPETLPWDGNEAISQRFYLLIGILALFVVGLFPPWIYPWFVSLSGSYGFLNP